MRGGRGVRRASARLLLAGVVCAALAAPWPTAARASAYITVTGRADSGTFTVSLRGAASLAGAARRSGSVVIVPVAGDLAQPPGRVVFTRPLPGINDIVVAQHDPAVVWLVAHLAGGPVPFTVSGTSGEVRVIFGRAEAGTAPPPIAHPQPPAPPPPAAPPRPPVAHPPAPAKPATGPTLTVSVNWAHTPLNRALADLENATDTVIIADIGVDGFLTLRMDNAPLDDVLQAIANQLHVHFVKKDDTYWLTRGS